MNVAIWCLCLCLGASVVFLNLSGKLGQDSQVEELAEEIIEELIDVDLDLSPLSKEAE